MGCQSFTDLKVWQVANGVYVEIYRLTETWPQRDQYELASQMRRAAHSVTANIAEGFCRRTTRDKAHFFTIAAGSAEELKNSLLAAKALGKLPSFPSLWPKNESVAKMLRSLTDKILREGTTYREPDA